MKINICEDFERHRSSTSVSPARIGDFKPKHSLEVSVASLVNSGLLAVPYALSEDLNKVCVTYHDEVDKLCEGAFFYQSQFRCATRISIDSSLMLPLFVSASDSNSARPVFIVSPGRVGSTLISNAFKFGGVSCLSEPDALSSFKFNEYNNGSKEYKRNFEILLQSCVSLYCDVGSVIKLRSYSAALVPLLYKLFPGARFVFLFRSVDAWSESMFRAFDYGREDLVWVLNQSLRAYSHVKEAGANAFVFGYEEFVEDPVLALKHLSRMVDNKKFDSASAVKAFDFDSQAGSGIDRSVVGSKKFSGNKVSEFLRDFDKQLLPLAESLGIAGILRVGR